MANDELPIAPSTEKTKYSAIILDNDELRAQDYADSINLSISVEAKVVSSIDLFFMEVMNGCYDIYIVDIGMKDIENHFEVIDTQGGWRTGLAVMHELREKRPDAIVLALTFSEAPEVVTWFTSDDRLGYFNKQDYGPEAFAQALSQYLNELD